MFVRLREVSPICHHRRLVNLILLDRGELGPGDSARLSGVRAAHLLAVLGVVVGQTVRVGLMGGPRGVGKVLAVAEGHVELACVFESTPPPRPRVDLLLAVPRPKVMRRLWAQLAALGVGRIILTNAERVERPYFDTHVLSSACYLPLLIEGLQQARDTWLPEVSIHRRFKPLVEDELDDLSGKGVRLVADPSGPMSVSDGLHAREGEDRDARLLLAVGPEGGWNAFELDLLAAHGFGRVGMGSRTLRTDTACVALLALVSDAMSRRE